MDPYGRDGGFGQNRSSPGEIADASGEQDTSLPRAGVCRDCSDAQRPLRLCVVFLGVFVRVLSDGQTRPVFRAAPAYPGQIHMQPADGLVFELATPAALFRG